MIINNINIVNFRNLKNINFDASKNINVIYGDNANGKTNIIEAMWLFSGFKSFRNSNDSEMKLFNQDYYDININFFNNFRNQSARILYYNKKNIFLNKIKLKNKKELISKIKFIVFTPIDLNIVTENSKIRRSYLNSSISQIKPLYNSYICQYEKILFQRNYILKNYNSDKKKLIDVFDIQLSKIGTLISLIRYSYIEKISPICRKIYFELSASKENIDLIYNSTIFDKILQDKDYNKENILIYYDKLKSSFKKDLNNGYTNLGIHKDDFKILINNKDCRKYGSQGQQRSCVVAFKLSEAELITDLTQNSPIILLDDVMSELDINRQNYILNNIKNFQVFITCCDFKNINNLSNGKVFNVKNGNIIFEKYI